MGQKVSRGELLTIAAGALALVASFLPFYTNGDSFNLWSTLLFPLATLIPIFVVLSTLLTLATRLQKVGTSRRLLGFSLTQLALALSFESAVLAWAFLFVRRGGLGLGVGYVLSLAAAIASVVGAFLVVTERQVVSDLGVTRRRRLAPSRSQRISPGEILIVLAAVVALVASLLPFYEAEFFGVVSTADYAIWSREFPFLFPVATLILVYAIASAFAVAVTRLSATEPGDVVGLRPTQLSLAFSVGAVLLAVAYLLQDKAAVVPFAAGVDLGIGYYLLLAACVGSTVGAVLFQLSSTRTEAV